MSAASLPPGLTIIGEGLNTNRPDFGTIVRERDEKAFLKELRRQQRSGVTHLDFNASGSGSPDSPNAERDALLWMLDNALPAMKNNVGLVLDSLSPDVIAAGLERIGGRAGTILNGMTADFEHIQKLLPLLSKSEIGAVAILTTRNQPQNAGERLKLAEQLLDIVTKARIAQDRIYIDPQVLPLAADAAHVSAVLELCGQIKHRWPRAHLLAGLSNISFNLPQRRLLNRTLAPMLLSAGVDTLICDPTDRALRQTLLAAQALLGRDDFFATYLSQVEQHRG
ncbi:MAG TPA: dihydropteroate synthase [Planctomycetota bacterium]|nr:dihydropteroate synthase [Planctomycetota bacterium]